MFREGNPLLKVGVILMASLALVIAAVVVGVTLGSEPWRAAADVASKSIGVASRYSSGSTSRRLGTARPPALVSRWGSARRMTKSRRRLPLHPNPRSLDQRYLNRGASKHPLSPNTDHNSTKPSHESNFCRRRKILTGQGPPEKSYRAPTLHATTTFRPGR